MLTKDYLKKENICLFFHNGEIWSLGNGWKNLTEYDKPGWKKKWRNLLKPKFYRGKNNLLLFDSFSQGYFHWVADVMPKLYLVRHELHEMNLLLPSSLRAYEEDSLRLFNVKNRMALPKRWQVGIALPLNYVQFPWRSGYFDNPLYDEYIPWLVAATKKLAKDVDNKGFHSKLFLNRKDATIRRILNIDDVEKIVTARDFQTAEVSKMQFIDQAIAFQQCQFLIAPHGAGLVNMIFMPRGSTIVELRSSYPVGNNIYERLAEKMGHKYVPIISTAPDYNENFQEADLYVPVEQLDGVISN